MSKNLSIRTLRRSITLQYTIALSLIATLSTVAFFFLGSALEGSSNTAFIVNISGKQRMLSQHIALDVHRIHEDLLHEKVSNIESHNRKKLLLTKHIQEMLVANKMLSSGILPDKQNIELSPVIYDMYFGQMNLNQRVKDYVSIAEKITISTDYNQANKFVDILNLQSEPLLVDLNKAVQQYEIEGENKLLSIKTMELAVWGSTIFILLIEAIFIFQPLVRKIVKLTETEERSIENLQHEVEKRTLHLEQANQKLENLASHDPLTRLKNRLNLESDLEDIMHQHDMHQAPYAVLMFDIDWFKKVNDTYGHDAGDVVLIEFANLLKQSVRQGDWVYRIGGEEFVILLNRATYEDTLIKAENIRKSIEKHTFTINDAKIKKTVSGGLYHSSLKNIKNVKEILKLVDNALYISKSKGRNRVSNIQ